MAGGLISYFGISTRHAFSCAYLIYNTCFSTTIPDKKRGIKEVTKMSRQEKSEWAEIYAELGDLKKGELINMILNLRRNKI